MVIDASQSTEGQLEKEITRYYMVGCLRLLLDSARQPSFLAALKSEGWSGREDLNAPEAHKPPWRVALPAFGGLRLPAPKARRLLFEVLF